MAARRDPPHPWASHLVVVGLWAASVGAASLLSPSEAVINVAAAVHIVGLIFGLGPIILIDWYGLVWLAGLRRFRDILRLADSAHPVIWGGSLLLLGSGAFLDPDLSRPLTWVKLVLMLVVVNNGVAVRALGRQLRQHRNPTGLHQLPRRLRHTMLGLLITSQTSWWGAVLIGFITSASR